MTTRTTLIIGAIVVVLVFLGGMALQQNRDTVNNGEPTHSATPTVSVTPTPTPTATPTPVSHIINRTNGGVSPQSVTVRVGDTITFINDGTTGFWPASDPHPLHILCPGFDARRALQSGESYSIVFSQARTCTYHNHVAPSDTAQQGTIIVQ